MCVLSHFSMAPICAIILLFVSVGWGVNSHAEQHWEYDKLLEEQTVADELLEGIISDRTITINGHEFYDYFARAWLSSPGALSFNLTVHERPSARWGSLIWIEHEQRIIYRAFVFPARSDIEKASEKAARTVAEQLKQLEMRRLLVVDPDLERDEL